MPDARNDTGSGAGARVEAAGLRFQRPLYDFLVDEAPAGPDLDRETLFTGFAELVEDFTPRNQALSIVARSCSAPSTTGATSTPTAGTTPTCPS